MDEVTELRCELVRFIKRKFYSRQSIADLADDIVNEAFLQVYKGDTASKINFGYLSAICIHIAFSIFKRQDEGGKMVTAYDSLLNFIDTCDVEEEIIASNDATEILASLEVLKAIEKIIVMQRYYGDYSFAEIAKANNIKLNTVLSHHRRALERLRPTLSQFSQGRLKAATRKEKLPHGNFSTIL